jgi:hypothetical protein
VLEEVKLQELAGSARGALVGALRAEDRVQLPQVVVEDRVPAPIPVLRNQLADAGVCDPLDLAQQARDLLPVRLELRYRGGSGERIARRMVFLYLPVMRASP